MVKAKDEYKGNFIGRWSFLVGFILSILLGLGLTSSHQNTILIVVFMLGVVVGILNIASRETSAFLTSSTVLVLVSFLGIQVGIFENIAPAIINILKGILTLFVPATIIAALKSSFVMAKK